MADAIKEGRFDNYMGNIEQECRRALNQMSEEEQKSNAGKIVSFLLQSGGIIDVSRKIKNCTDCRKQIEHIEELRNIIDSQDIVGEDTVKRVANGTKLEWVKDKVQVLVDVICSKGKCSAQTPVDSREAHLAKLRDEFSRQLETSKKEMAESTIENSSISSAVMIAVQFIKLYLVWKDIHKAQNLIEASKKEIPKIEAQMANLAQEAATIVRLMDQYEEAKEKERRLSLAQQVDRLTRRISRKLNATQIQIGELKAEIGKKIERIDVRRDEQVLDGVTNLAQGIAGALQLFTLWRCLSNGYRILQGVITGSFFLLTIGNTYTFVITGATLKELRTQMESIRNLTHEVLELQKITEEAEDWCTKTIVTEN